MIETPAKERKSYSRLGPIVCCGAFAYLTAAYAFNLPPFPQPEPAVCPVSASAYQAFVDPTGSNQNRENWQVEVERFAATLDSCDRVSFYIISDNTRGEAEFGKAIVFPLVDPNAPLTLGRGARNEIKELRDEVVGRLQRMMKEDGATKSDILGVFAKLKPAASPERNVLVIFSDSKESAKPGVNLEDGQPCISKGNLDKLVDTALAGHAKAENLSGFAAIQWVVPKKSGKPGCNGRDELKLFWSSVLKRWSGGVPLQFDTNVFEVRS